MPQFKALVVLLSFLPLIIASSSEVQELRAENTELKRLMTSLEERFSQLDDTVFGLTTLAEQMNTTAELEERVTVLEETVTVVETTLTEVGESLVLLEDDIEDQDDAINTLQGETSLLQTQILDNNAQIRSVEDEIEDVAALTSDLDTRVDTLETSQLFQDTIFFAALETDSSSTADPVLFERDVINNGFYYNPLTGYYTVPYNGIYEFHVFMTAYSSSATFSTQVRVDGTGIHVDSWSDGIYRSVSVLLELQAGQLVSVYRGGGAQGDPATFRSYFWGRMISAL